MKIRLGWVAAILALASFAALTTAAEVQPPPSGQFGLDIAFSRAAEPDTYLCTATVTDLLDGRVLAAPKVTARAGEPATTHTGFTARGESHDLALTFTVRSEREVAYRFSYSRNGRVVSIQSALVKL
jgi:hypothetical protein